ncbi:MAG: OmpA family protein [Elusimicrobiota bacterium]|nr:OmpA family protein [Elusimicrobiota bacterium]
MSPEINTRNSDLAPDDGDIEVGKGSPPWMTTYGDLMTQLLIFFVMMFALAATLNEMQLNRIKERLEKYTIENNLENVINLKINDKGLVISLSEKIMFDSGKAEIYDEAKEVLADISTEIIDVPNDIRVEGHTDSVPIKTDIFPSNWELSGARATNITRFLIEELNFPPDRMSAGGYGKYHPVVQTAYSNEIVKYKNEVRAVPEKYSEQINRAKTEEEKNRLFEKVREEQLQLQREMQEVIQRHLAEANRTAAERAKNRRVDIIVQRISSRMESPIDTDQKLEIDAGN